MSYILDDFYLGDTITRLTVLKSRLLRDALEYNVRVLSDDIEMSVSDGDAYERVPRGKEFDDVISSPAVWSAIRLARAGMKRIDDIKTEQFVTEQMKDVTFFEDKPVLEESLIVDELPSEKKDDVYLAKQINKQRAGRRTKRKSKGRAAVKKGTAVRKSRKSGGR